MPAQLTTVMIRGVAFTAVVLIGLCSQAFAGDGPLHRQIDALIAEAAGDRTTAPQADDAEFLRRVYLDLAGEIPTAAEARAFFADDESDKRAKLIDKLLADPRFAPHLADRFHIMLMERRGDDPQWKQYLEASFKANKPWDQLAREILSPDPENEKTRAAAYFMTRRLEKYGQNPTDYPGLTRDVGRIFLGVDLQCAQCHDDLFVDDYDQIEFQGLFIAYQNLKLQTGGEFPSVSEGLITGKMEFTSVFGNRKLSVGPRVPFGEEVEIAVFEKGKEYAVAPDRKKRTAGVPKFSPLAELSRRVASEDNRLFARNIANRLWFLMMGRGLVHPLDLHHSDNPASHPKLLDLLADEMVARDFDTKWMLRQLALTETYQRSSRQLTRDATTNDAARGASQGDDKSPESLFLVAAERRLHHEQLLRATLIATGHEKLLAVQDPAKDTPYADLPSLETFREKFADAFANERAEPEEQVSFTLKGSLFLLNDETLLKLVQPREGNLIARLGKMKEDGEAIEELFLSLLTRLPDDAEREQLTNWLKQQDDRTAALGQITWAMLASAEFAMNH